MSDSIISTMDLTKRFEDLVAVDHLNLNIEDGEIFGLLGPNGAGKTTTVLMLTTVIKPSRTQNTLGQQLVGCAELARKGLWSFDAGTQNTSEGSS